MTNCEFIPSKVFEELDQLKSKVDEIEANHDGSEEYEVNGMKECIRLENQFIQSVNKIFSQWLMLKE